ncbi:MAG: hypothetical protein ACUVTD_08165 [Nitrososphaerales archaeon]
MGEYTVEEVEEKILKTAEEFGLDVKKVKEMLDYLKERKKKIRGVWAVPKWMWIAIEQDTKYTWYGVTFSPIVPEGEFGTWYLWEPPAVTIIEPAYRWKVEREELERMRKKIEEIL